MPRRPTTHVQPQLLGFDAEVSLLRPVILLGVQVAPMGMLIFWLVFNVAMAALFGYVGVMVYRGMKRLGWW